MTRNWMNWVVPSPKIAPRPWGPGATLTFHQRNRWMTRISSRSWDLSPASRIADLVNTKLMPKNHPTYCMKSKNSSRPSHQSAEQMVARHEPLHVFVRVLRVRK